MKKYLKVSILIVAFLFFIASFGIDNEIKASCNDSSTNCFYGIAYTSLVTCSIDTECSSNCNSSHPYYRNCCKTSTGRCKISNDQWEKKQCDSSCSTSSGGGGNSCGCDTAICAECPTYQ